MTTFSARFSVSRSSLPVFLIFFLACGFSQFAYAQDTQVFINELHYDNAGTDVGEAIEIAGPAGTDLSSWSIVRYNGSNGTSYGTDILGGLIPDQDNGFGTVSLSYPSNGIQNGSPDGIALVNGSVVVQFLSYEGSLTAIDGPAAGMTSVDIGVSESSGTIIGDSLQLAGAGSFYEHFIWAAPQANSIGSVNAGQSFGGEPAAPVLVINEIDYDQPSTDGAEFIELKNVGSGNANLVSFEVQLVNGSTGAVYKTIALPDVTLGSGDYFVICGNASTTANCDLDVSPDSNLVQNGSPDAVSLWLDGAVVDAVSYEGSVAPPFVEGSGSGLEDGSGAELSGISRFPDGVDTDQNNVDLSPRCITPGTENLARESGCADTSDLPSVVINEVDADQASTDSAEFVELYDGGDGNTDLSGLSIVLYNGSDNRSYLAFDLDGQSTDGDGYFVLCGNTATVANCDLDVSPNTNLIQNGEDAVTLLVGDAADYPNDSALPPDTDIVDAIVYETFGDSDAGLLGLLNAGQGVVDEGGAGDSVAHSNQRCLNGTGGARNTDTYSQFAPTPGLENTCGTGGPVFGMCSDPATFIHEAQGAGSVSPITGSDANGVVLEGVVVGDFQANDQLRGFFLQEEDSDNDADPATSEGIFVFDSGFGTDVAVGDVVRVQGDLSEFFGLTQLGNVGNLAVCGSGFATATEINLPVGSLTEWEAHEGMLLTIPQTLYVSGNFNLARYGELDLSVGAPLDNPTNVVAPGADAQAFSELNNRSRIQLDDGSSVQNPLSLPPYLGVDNSTRIGDSVDNVTAVLSYSFSSYELHPVGPGTVEITRLNTRPAPPIVGGAVRVASFNVLNYFTTLDDSGPICGPLASIGCRGADTADELMRQRDKLIAAIGTLDAHVVGLIELENPVDDYPIADLVEGLNSSVGAGTYDYVETRAIGDDAIRVGLIYQSAVVSPINAFAILDSSVDPLFDDSKNRPALAQSFAENGSGEIFTVAVNHLKSKGSNCNSSGDPDTGDGQGNCNVTRTKAAIALADWLANDPTGSGSYRSLILGDLNAYSQEDPINVIEAAGFVDVIEALNGTGVAAGAYSFNFFAESGSLDHALSSPDLLPSITGAGIWHINSDEPSGLDYNDHNQPDLYNADEFRSSDHDPLVVGLFPDSDNDGVIDLADYCPETVISESVPTKKLNNNHWALTDGDFEFDTVTSGKGSKGGDRSYSTSDTAGCSCEQIIEAQGLGNGLTKYGCTSDVMDNWVRLVTP